MDTTWLIEGFPMIPKAQRGVAQFGMVKSWSQTCQCVKWVHVWCAKMHGMSIHVWYSYKRIAFCIHFESMYHLMLIHFIRCHFCGFPEIHFQIHTHAIWCYASHNLALLWFLRSPILISTIWSYASHNQALLWLFWNPLLNLPTIWSYVFNNMPLLWPFLYIHFSSVPGT